jgi:hypothetical protein
VGKVTFKLIVVLSVVFFGALIITSPIIKVYADTLGSVGSWNSISPTSGSSQNPASLEYDGYLYEFGGISPNRNTVSSAPLSNGTVGAWSMSSNLLPGSLIGGLKPVEYDGYVYVFSGGPGTIYSAQLGANGTVGAWSSPTSTLNVHAYAGVSFEYDGYVYVMGGLTTANSSSATNTVYSAPLSNGAVGSWTTSSNVLPSVINSGMSVVYNGYIFVMGGNGASTNLNTVYSAPISNGRVGSWSTATNMPVSVNTYDTAIEYGGYTYVINGQGGNAIYSAQLTGFLLPSLPSTPPLVNVTDGSSSTVNVVNGVANDPDPSSITIVSGPLHGTAYDPPGTITYNPNAGYSGPDSLTYQVCSLDDESLCSQGTLLFNVTLSPTAGAPDTGFGAPTSHFGSSVELLTAVISLGLAFILTGVVILTRRNVKFD